MENYVDEIMRKLDTRDVFEIAESAGVKIVYESWHPTTVGEFERKTRTILMNRIALEKSDNAKTLKKEIVAHELGHFYAIDLKLERKEEERFARAFAERLLENGR
jgi:predicted SprT family Zn-dependent metalloprotease